MKRGEIWLVSVDPSQGREQQGTRPVLIVSPDRFNAISRMPVVLPVTSGGSFARSAGFAVPLTNSGTRTTGVIRCDQPRPIELMARNARMLESVPARIIDEVLARLAPIFCE